MLAVYLLQQSDSIFPGRNGTIQVVFLINLKSILSRNSLVNFCAYILYCLLNLVRVYAVNPILALSFVYTQYRAHTATPQAPCGIKILNIPYRPWLCVNEWIGSSVSDRAALFLARLCALHWSSSVEKTKYSPLRDFSQLLPRPTFSTQRYQFGVPL